MLIDGSALRKWRAHARARAKSVNESLAKAAVGPRLRPVDELLAGRPPRKAISSYLFVASRAGLPGENVPCNYGFYQFVPSEVYISKDIYDGLSKPPGCLLLLDFCKISQREV